MIEGVILGVGLLWNCATVWWFCSYLPRRWDSPKPGQIPDSPELIQYTVGSPDTRGLV